jgi:hypothetical protein
MKKQIQWVFLLIDGIISMYFFNGWGIFFWILGAIIIFRMEYLCIYKRKKYDFIANDG